MHINYEASTSSAIAINVDVEVGARLQLALDLNGQNEANGFDATDSDKIVALANAALDLASANFPILRESTWLVLLDAQHEMAGNHLSAVRNAPRPQQRGYFEWLLSESANFHDPGLVNPLETEQLPEEAALAVYLVGNLFWSKGNSDLRQIISQISGLPYDRVFKGD